MSTMTIAPAGTWALDPVHSTVGFEVDYLGGTFRGQFREVEATLDVRDGTAALAGTAKVESVDVRDENLAAHLASPEFFDAERHPELRFAARELRLDGDRVDVEGDLTIRGVTEPVTVSGAVAAPIADAYGNERIGLRVRATVDRTAFGLAWNVPLPSGEPALSNEVVIVGELFFVRRG